MVKIFSINRFVVLFSPTTPGRSSADQVCIQFTDDAVLATTEQQQCKMWKAALGVFINVQISFLKTRFVLLKLYSQRLLNFFLQIKSIRFKSIYLFQVLKNLLALKGKRKNKSMKFSFKPNLSTYLNLWTNNSFLQDFSIVFFSRSCGLIEKSFN